MNEKTNDNAQPQTNPSADPSGPPPPAAQKTVPAAPPPGEHILQFFGYSQLPPHLQAVSKPFHDLAWMICGRLAPDLASPADAAEFPLPRNPERTVALRKLLEAKDAAVRAALAK
jgi:hypothetical protein